MKRNFAQISVAAAVAGLCVAVLVSWRTSDVVNAQAEGQPPPNPPSSAGGAQAPAGGAPHGFHLPFPQHKTDAEAVARGKGLYGVNCAFCHGADAGGGAVGPNLLRSQIVIEDQNGELITPIVHGSRAARGMPALPLTDAQISDVAQFLHSFQTGASPKDSKPIDIVVGNATQGKATFDQLCSSCHSVTGDLAGFATKIPDARAMQQAWLLPGGPSAGGTPGARGAGATALHVPPATVTVTLEDGQRVEGTLNRIDDFYVSLTTPSGDARTFSRRGDEPKVELHDPVAAHRALIPKYTDQQIHDITAYLRTIR